MPLLQLKLEIVNENSFIDSKHFYIGSESFYNVQIADLPGAPYVVRPARPRSYLDFEK